MNAVVQTQMQAPVAPSVAPSQAGLLHRKCACGGSSGMNVECADCEEKKLSLDRFARMPEFGMAATNVIPPIVHDVVRSSGRPLDDETRTFMEPRFGHDFSNVRVHTDSSATESARAVNAVAYTVGRHIVFDSASYSPRTRTGRELIAHELTHTLQQDGNANSPVNEISDPNDKSEIEASRLAAQIVAHGESGDLASMESHDETDRSVDRLARNVVQRHTLENDPATAPAMLCNVATDMVADYLLNVQFPKGDATISAVDQMILADFATEWNLSPVQPTVRVDGFASIEGGPDKNWPLSCNRAAAVVNELTTPTLGGKPGIPAASVEHFANGETERFSTSLTPNQVVGIHAPGVAMPASREPSVHSWSARNSGGLDASNCCLVCPATLGLDCKRPDIVNGIELTASIRDHDPAFSYDIKRTKEVKYHRALALPFGYAGPWQTIPSMNKPAGSADDSHDSDECLVPTPNGSVHNIFSTDNPGFTSAISHNYQSWFQLANFIEFVRITRSDGSTYDDVLQQNWHTKMLVEDKAGVWTVNATESEIDTGHLGSLDP